MSVVSIRYSESLYEVSIEKNRVSEVYKDFSSFVLELRTSEELRAVFESKAIKINDKKRVIESLGLEEKLFTNFLKLLLDKERQNYILDIYDAFLKLYQKNQNIVELEIVSAKRLSDKDSEQIEQVFEKKLNKKIIIKNAIDEEIIGGYIVYYDDVKIDYSLKNKLENITKELESREIF